MLAQLNRIWDEKFASSKVDRYTPTKADSSEKGSEQYLETVVVQSIKNNPVAYEQILQYKSIDFSVLLEMIRQDGVKCSKKILADILDKQGVSYTNRKTSKKTKTSSKSNSVT